MKSRRTCCIFLRILFFAFHPLFLIAEHIDILTDYSSQQSGQQLFIVPPEDILPTDEWSESPTLSGTNTNALSGGDSDTIVSGNIIAEDQGVQSGTNTISGVIMPSSLEPLSVSIAPLSLPNALVSVAQSAASQLIISEVFFDGIDERFELSNIGSGDFIGPLVVKGTKSADLSLGSVTIPVGAVYLWGDTLAQVVDKSMVKGSGLGLSISDTSVLNVGLYSSGLLLDSFFVDTGTVSTLPNNYGFEKVRSGSTLVTLSTSTGRVSNISGSWIANPGIVMTLPLSVGIGSGTNQDSGGISPPPGTGGNTTGTTLSGNTLSGDISSGNMSSGNIFSGTNMTGYITGVFFISEIHPDNDLLPEYIELHFEKAFSGMISIAGLGSASAAKTMHIVGYTGEYIVITDTLSGFVDTSPVMLIDSVSLTDGGESLRVTDALGNIYDQQLYMGSDTRSSRYRSETGQLYSSPCTPGFSDKALVYLSSISSFAVTTTTKTTAQDNYYQTLYKKRKDRYYDLKSQVGAFGISVNTAGMAYKKSGASSDIELVNDAEEFSALDLAFDLPHIRIVALLPDADGKDDGSEQITIVSEQPGVVDLSSFFIHINTKKSPLRGLLEFSGDRQTLKGNFGFVNKPACITLEQGKSVIDTFCYGQPKAGQWIGLSGQLNAADSLSGVTDFSWMKELHITLLTGQACALFGDSPFQCISVKSTMDEKSKAKFEKKISSLQTKLDKKTSLYTGLQERYRKSKTTLEAKRRKYYEQVKAVRNTYKGKVADAQLETKIRKNYGTLVQSYLKKSRPIVWQNTDMISLQSIMDSNIHALKGAKKNSQIALQGQIFTIGDLKKQYAFVSDPAVFYDYMIKNILTHLSKKAAFQWNQWLEIRYKEE